MHAYTRCFRLFQNGLEPMHSARADFVFLLLADLPPDAEAEPDIRRGPLQGIQQHPDHSNSS